jgi:hypothetical protein
MILEEIPAPVLRSSYAKECGKAGIRKNSTSGHMPDLLSYYISAINNLFSV